MNSKTVDHGRKNMQKTNLPTRQRRDEDYLKMADTIGINRSTARGIIARYLRDNQINERLRDGRNNIKVDEELRDCTEIIVNKNCMLTLTAINAELRRRLPEKRITSDRTVGNHLDGMLYSLKRAYRRPTERNRSDVIECRHEYAQCSLVLRRSQSPTYFVCRRMWL